jgi:glycosyltransferase involved in cell wall biosynthesis
MAYSPTESLPIKILGRMASGTRVTATAVSGISDIIIPTETGYLVGNRRIDGDGRAGPLGSAE